MWIVKRIVNGLKNQYRKVFWQICKIINATITFNTKQGTYKYKVINDDPINMQLFIRKEYEHDIIINAVEFLQNKYKIDNKIFVDIGANNGVISITMMLKKYFEKSIAIEPEPNNYKALQRNIRLNKLEDRIVLRNIGLSDNSGQLTFELSESNFGDHRVMHNNLKNLEGNLYNEHLRKTISINCEKLDTCLEDFSKDVSLIWIDVQGYEPYVFKGAVQFFEENNKVVPVVSEFWPYGMKKAGVSKDDFVEIVSSIFSHYYVWRRGRFLKYEILNIGLFWDELDYNSEFENVIYVNESK